MELNGTSRRIDNQLRADQENGDPGSTIFYIVYKMTNENIWRTLDGMLKKLGLKKMVNRPSLDQNKEKEAKSRR